MRAGPWKDGSRKEADMTETMENNTLTEMQFAHLGEGVIAYMREIGAEELMGSFPGIPNLKPGTKLWALFAAKASPSC
jgi:hypothetical protein